MASSSGTPPESTLLERTVVGDRRALDTLIARHLPGLRAFVRLRMDPLLRAREEADDIVQSTCRQLLQDLDRFEYRGEVEFRSWLYGAVLNKLREKHRYHRAAKRDVAREQPIDDERWLRAYASVATPSQRAAAREHALLVERAFDRLSEQYREVLTLSRVVGLSHAQIAAQTGRSEGSVRNLMTRALVKLSEALVEVEQ